MTEAASGLRLGPVVPGFELAACDPRPDDVGPLSPAEQRARGRWTTPASRRAPRLC